MGQWVIRKTNTGLVSRIETHSLGSASLALAAIPIAYSYLDRLFCEPNHDRWDRAFPRFSEKALEYRCNFSRGYLWGILAFPRECRSIGQSIPYVS